MKTGFARQAVNIASVAVVIAIAVLATTHDVWWLLGDLGGRYETRWITALTLSGASALLLARTSGHWLGWTMAVGAFTAATGLLAGVLLTVATWPEWFVRGAGWWYKIESWQLTWAAVLLLPVFFPGDTKPSPRWLPVIAVISYTTAAGAIYLASSFQYLPGDPAQQQPILQQRPAGLTPTVTTWLPVLTDTTSIGTLLVIATSAAVMAFRWRRSTDLSRRRYALLAGTLIAEFVLVAYALVGAYWPTLAATGTVAALLAIPRLLLIPAVAVFCLTRRSVYQFELAIWRTLVFAVTVAALALILAGTYTAISWWDGPALAVAALCAGAALPLVIRHSWRLVDHWYFGDRAEPHAVLRRVSNDTAHIAPDEMPHLMCQAVAEALRFPAVGLFRPEGTSPLAVYPAVAAAELSKAQATGTCAEFPLRHRGSHVGTLVVVPRDGQRTFDPADRQVLGTVADYAAAAVAAVSLAEQLRESRAAIVSAREEERRRLRHDLHDGLGPALAGIGLCLDAALERPTAAPALISQATKGLREAIAEVRSLAAGLRPPVLDELGLSVALHHLAGRFSSQALTVTVEILRLPPLPAAVEVAVYRITAEALTNVTRHSNADTAAVTLRADSTRLLLTIHDNGTGATPGDTGVGLRSMSMRATELGGETVIRFGEGVRISAWLPLGVTADPPQPVIR